VQAGAAGHAHAVDEQRVRVLRQHVPEWLVLAHLAIEIVDVERVRMTWGKLERAGRL
jgi:hypothetical protein